MGLGFEVVRRRGKGSHVLVQVGDRATTVPGREIDPVMARIIRKQPGLE